MKGCLISFIFFLSYFLEILVFNANSVDPDQTPHNAASDQGLHCLPISLFGMLSINGLNSLLKTEEPVIEECPYGQLYKYKPKLFIVSTTDTEANQELTIHCWHKLTLLVN